MSLNALKSLFPASGAAFSTRHALIALNRVPRIGAAKVRSLERAFGSLEAASKVSAETLAQQCKDIGAALAAEALAALKSSFGADEEARASKCSVTILTLADEDYPERLRNSPSPPLCLYCAGDTRLLHQTQIAIIGTRNASIYGAEQAKRFAFALASAGLHITSGLAEGIDSAAHEGALLAAGEGPGRTLAIIGAALDCVYPASRKPMARDIVRSGGLVVSEYPFGRHADAKTFPQRNRIVAALAHGLLIAEAPYGSGTLITTNMAHGLGRTLYALPGRADWPSFAGNHALLRAGDARLVTTPEHILEDFGARELAGAPPAPQGTPTGLTAEERAIWEAADPEGVSLDQLCARTGLPLPQVMELSIGLQLRRHLRALPGGLLRQNR